MNCNSNEERNVTNVFYGNCCCGSHCGSDNNNGGTNINIIDDTIVSTEKTWSSDKIQKEIEANSNGVTKFENLLDVEVSNKQNGQVVVYDEVLGKFISTNVENVFKCEDKLKQVSKLGVTGTIDAPEVVDIEISTLDFKVPKVNVLKFQKGQGEQIKILNTFSSGEKAEFEEDNMVIFDDTAHLKMQHDTVMDYERDIENYKAYCADVDKCLYKTINSISVTESETNNILNLNAVPKDRLVVNVKDLDLSNADVIEYFNLVATGGVKVVCSTDSGTTWKTFKDNAWTDVNLTVADVAENGIAVDVFNSIMGIQWSELLEPNKKIRFAYLLTDNNSIDELKLQYSGEGYWIEAKDSEYDVVYASNSLMKVKLYFNGDVKINY